MVGPSEVALSRDLVLRAQKRLVFQRAVVSRLESDGGSQLGDEVRDIYLVLQTKLERMIKQHDELVGGTSKVSSCRKTS